MATITTPRPGTGAGTDATGKVDGAGNGKGGGPLKWIVGAAAGLMLAVVAAVAVLLLVVVSALSGGGGGVSGLAPSSVPGVNAVLLDAFGKAAAATPTVAPKCTGMRWSILAGIAQVESNLAAGRQISPTGDITPHIIGPALNGSGVGGNRTAIYDTDGGRWDGDTVYDRAVGAVQFIPTSWVAYGRDGNGDGVADPHNAYDVTLGAVVHLCGTSAKDLSNREQLSTALYGYNRSQTYVAKVLANIDTFDQIGVAAGGAAVPEASGRAAVVIAAARQWTGTPYSWGGGSGRPGPGGTVIGGPSRGFGRGANTVGFDCSGLTQYAYAVAGIQLPRVSSQQSLQGQRIPRSAGLEAVAPGDLIFFGSNPGAGTGIYHVAIYLGGGQMINAPRTGTFVREEAVWMSSYAGAVHFP
ncbi:NlpC/P60 family protein [Kineococcus radiotolerans]|uniref:NLP/P60 protein n=1 Tax=Kineococcus radiotolerans (strain ATCC BAA-149 / DSM 14245 / SRS30216) TaxID=266940 RepID=A6WGZ9_KINRD|nr:C40 family peptidase [Kineococcus radiotolerans]ABS06088.1 NLP/P60 protein [Kineococcus radiotolerans SRS30216 = ATCC BAA-149]